MSDRDIAIMIGALAVGTFLLRFSFLGLIGNRPLPEFIMRLLRYTPVAVLPALVTPLVLWPDATGGTFDPARTCATAATLFVGYKTRNVLYSIATGFSVLMIGLFGPSYL